MDEETTEILADLYGLITNVYKAKDIKTAEAAKVIENIQRDLNIALMNELALIFEKMGIDVMDVIEAASTKWNFKVFYPGPGVGGGCLPVNPYYLVKKAEELGFHSKVITAGRSINDYMPIHVFNLLLNGLNEAGKSVKNSRVVILGFSYKENVGDIRLSPTIPLIKKLKAYGADVIVVDPLVKTSDIKRYNVGVSEMDKLNDIDAIVLMTAHEQFKDLNFSDLIRKSRPNPVFVDGRRVYDPELIKKHGFIYRGIGFGEEN